MRRGKRGDSADDGVDVDNPGDHPRCLATTPTTFTHVIKRLLTEATVDTIQYKSFNV